MKNFANASGITYHYEFLFFCMVILVLSNAFYVFLHSDLICIRDSLGRIRLMPLNSITGNVCQKS